MIKEIPLVPQRQIELKPGKYLGNISGSSGALAGAGKTFRVELGPR
jgi:hypothetical protein